MNKIPNYRVWHKIEKRFIDLRSIDFEQEIEKTFANLRNIDFEKESIGYDCQGEAIF